MPVAINQPTNPASSGLTREQQFALGRPTDLQNILTGVQIAGGVFGIGANVAGINEAIQKAHLEEQQTQSEKTKNQGLAYQQDLLQKGITSPQDVIALQKGGGNLQKSNLDANGNIDPNLTGIHQLAFDPQGKPMAGETVYLGFPQATAENAIAGNKAAISKYQTNATTSGQILPSDVLAEMGKGNVVNSGNANGSVGFQTPQGLISLTNPKAVGEGANMQASAAKTRQETKNLQDPNNEKSRSDLLGKDTNVFLDENAKVVSSNQKVIDSLTNIKDTIDDPTVSVSTKIQTTIGGLAEEENQKRLSPVETPYFTQHLGVTNLNPALGPVRMGRDFTGLSDALDVKIESLKKANANLGAIRKSIMDGSSSFSGIYAGGKMPAKSPGGGGLGFQNPMKNEKSFAGSKESGGVTPEDLLQGNFKVIK